MTDDFGMVGLPSTMAEDVAEVPDVASVVPIRFAPAFVGDDTTAVTGTNDGVFELLDLDIVDGDRRLAPGDVVIDQDKARSHNLGGRRRRSPIRFLDDAARGRSAPPRCPASTTPGPPENIGSYVIGLDDYHAAVPTPTDVQVFVQLQHGVSVAEAEPAIDGSSTRSPRPR